MFQEVEANPASFERYIDDMVAACRRKGVSFRFATDVAREPGLLAPFDRIVVATGAAIRFGLGPLAMRPARSRRRPLAGLSRLMSAPRAARLVLLPRAPRHRRRASRGWPGPARPSS